LRPSTFMSAIEDWVLSLSRHGFDRIYFLNGHGGNVATIEATFSQIYSNYSYAGQPCPFILKLKNWWDLPGVTKLCAKLYPMGHGSHATPSEIALTFAAYREHIKSADLEPRIAPTGPIRDALDFRYRYPDGRMGADSALAKPEDGETIIATAVEGLIKDVKAFEAE
jgi:creatinine amidohydrolase